MQSPDVIHKEEIIVVTLLADGLLQVLPEIVAPPLPPSLPIDDYGPPPAHDCPPSPSTAKKRKRTPPKQTPKLKRGEDDNGVTCPICSDSWEMSGEHRIVSLKCGHLFGDSCIRHWLAGHGRKFCPQCKTKATNRDIRFLYARPIRALDRNEEHRLREQLDQEKIKVIQLQNELATLRMTRAETPSPLMSACAIQ